MSIKAVLFDLGGVLVRTEYQAPRQKLAERFGMDYEDIDRLVFASPTAARATVGEITEEEHWLQVMKLLKQPAAEHKNIEREFFGGDVLDRSLIQFLRSLRPQYKTGLISNAWSGLRAYIEREKFDDAFDALIISAEAKVAKPSTKIYHMALDQLGVSPNEAVFVDDVWENIQACEKVGMKGILFKSAESAIKQIKALL
jgi:epoxide hydrolase-like predicted phosphatase